MWPWEHLIFGYLLFSLLGRLGRRFDPGDRSAALLVTFTQFPDLVDKPLAWGLGVLPSGISAAHSVFVALPVAALAVLVGRRARWPTAGLGVAVGYLSHLLGDAVYPALTGGSVRIDAFLWPVVVVPSDRPADVAGIIQSLLANFATALAGETGPLYLGLELVAVAAAVGLWYDDGCPGLRRLGASGSRG